MSSPGLNRVSNALLLMPVLYGLAVIAAAIWKYRAANASVKEFAVGLTAGAGISLAFLAARRLKPAVKARLALVAVSTGGSLMLLEGVFYYHSHEKTAYRHQAEGCPMLGKEFDRRTKREVVLDLRARGIPAVPPVTPVRFYARSAGLRLGGKDLIPLGGVSKRTTVLCIEECQYCIYESDEHGFNNPAGLYVPGKVDVVALGDSFTQGMCPGNNRNLVAWVRDKHPRTINLGSSGNGPLSMLAGLTEYATPLRPKNVLWCYYEGNDLDDLRIEKTTLLRRYLDDGTFSVGLLTLQPEIDRELEQLIEAELASPVSDTGISFLFLTHLRNTVAEALRKKDRGEEEFQLFGNILRAAKERTERFGGRLHFVYLPGIDRYTRPGYSNQPHDRIREIVAGLGIPFTDVSGAFEKHGDPLGLFPFRDSRHYSGTGHRVAGEAILEALDGGPKR